MAKGTRFGRKAQEEAWQNVEVDALYRLAAAGVRVPRPHAFSTAWCVMELLTDADGNAAPRLNDVVLSEAQALDYHGTLIARDRAHALRRRHPRRPVRVQRARHRRRPGHHRPAAGGRRRGQQQRRRHAEARRRATSPPISAVSRRRSRPPGTATRSGRSTSARRCSPDTALTGRFATSTRPADVAAVMQEISRCSRRARGAAALQGDARRVIAERSARHTPIPPTDLTMTLDLYSMRAVRVTHSLALAALLCAVGGCTTMPAEDPRAATARAEKAVASPVRTDQDRRMDASRHPARVPAVHAGVSRA